MLFRSLGTAALAGASLLLPGTARRDPPNGQISADSAWKILQGIGRGGTAVQAGTSARRGASSSRIPPGQLPPAGMCRVWIQGVPPGRQPAATDCTSARVQSAQIPNSRIIYGDQQSFPGRGQGSVRRGGHDDQRGVRGRDDDGDESGGVLGRGDDDGDESGGVLGRGDDDGDESGGVLGRGDDDGDENAASQGSVRARGGRPSWAGSSAGASRGRGRGHGHG